MIPEVPPSLFFWDAMFFPEGVEHLSFEKQLCEVLEEEIAKMMLESCTLYICCSYHYGLLLCQ